ncbi:unnamed protein product [Mytilus coruscus]|uniref:Mab-21-like HhH/H2TH-like domain-containing protein n=1 Tax=Mytilus coruscus TaxID=42192 RepID=A0A6J8D6X1_MYTCO|nr:unnamed protein product [Mytilus coruscus]
MKSVLDAAGFSPTEIKFKKNTHDFHDFVSKQLCKADETIYVGSRAEGIAGGLYYSGDQNSNEGLIRPLCPIDNAKDILSSYCLKNLIFWCAEKEKLNWIPSNLIVCLHSCIQKLIIFLSGKNLPHYIIEERNLFNSKLTDSLSTSLQVDLNYFKDNIMDILYLKSFDRLKEASRDFCLDLLENVTEKSVILQCWDDKIKRLYHDFTNFQFFWLKYDRYSSLESILKYKDILSEIEHYKGFTVFKNEYTAIINSIIGLLSYSLYRQIPQQKKDFGRSDQIS